MSLAQDRVLLIPELLESILLSLPLHELLRVRQVSRAWNDLINNTPTIARVRAAPYIGVTLHVPAICSLSASEPPKMDADFTLYYDKPATIRKHPTCQKHGPSIITHKVELGSALPIEIPPRYVKRFCSRNRNSNELHPMDESRWMSLIPGIPHRVSWDFVAAGARRGPPGARDTGIGQNDVGKTFDLIVVPTWSLAAYAGKKESLLRRIHQGENVQSYKINPLALVGETEVRYSVVA